MGDILRLPSKSLAAKTRVKALAKGAVLYLNKAQREAEEKAERDHRINAALAELEMAFRKVCALSGPGVAHTHLKLVETSMILGKPEWR